MKALSWMCSDMRRTQCCLCLPLQTGAIVIAILDIVGGALSILAGVLIITTTSFNLRNNTENVIMNAIAFWSEVIFGALVAIEGLCLLFGAKYSNVTAVTVNIILSVVSTLLYLTIAGVFLTFGIFDILSLGYNYFGVFLAVAIFKSYFCLCVVSFLLELDSEVTEIRRFSTISEEISEEFNESENQPDSLIEPEESSETTEKKKKSQDEEHHDDDDVVVLSEGEKDEERVEEEKESGQ